MEAETPAALFATLSNAAFTCSVISGRSCVLVATLAAASRTEASVSLIAPTVPASRSSVSELLTCSMAALSDTGRAATASEVSSASAVFTKDVTSATRSSTASASAFWATARRSSIRSGTPLTEVVTPAAVSVTVSMASTRRAASCCSSSSATSASTRDSVALSATGMFCTLSEPIRF